MFYIRETDPHFKMEERKGEKKLKMKLISQLKHIGSCEATYMLASVDINSKGYNAH